MKKVCTAAALAVRTFITGSSNLSFYGVEVLNIALDLGLRVDDIDNIKKSRGSWLGTMVDFLGEKRVEAVYQLIANNDEQPSNWRNKLTDAQKSALNIQKRTNVYNSFKLFVKLWNSGNRYPEWSEEAALFGFGSYSKPIAENLAIRAGSNATGNCGETSLLVYLLLTTLPKDGKYQELYQATKDLTVGWYYGTNIDHAYVIVSNNGYNTDKGMVDSYCVCDPWLGRSYPDLMSDLHYDGANVNNLAQVIADLPEIKVGTYTYASILDNLTKVKGVMQIFHSALLEKWNEFK